METTGTASWDNLIDDFEVGQMPFQQLAPIADGPEACVSGSYFNPDQSGHGFVVQMYEVNGQLEVLVA